MQEYGELALALATENNLKISEDVFNQLSESSSSGNALANYNDKVAWKKLINGDKLALGDLYDQYVNILFSYGMYHSKDRGYVMDCIHDLFLDLYKYRKNLSKTDNVKYYLFKSLKRKINKKYKTKDLPVSKENFLFTFEGTSKNHSKSCEEEIIAQERILERNNNLSEALKVLTKKQRKVLYLRYNQDRTYEEISDIMGISVETARTSIYRAIKKLRKLKFHY